MSIETNQLVAAFFVHYINHFKLKILEGCHSAELGGGHFGSNKT